MEAVLTENLVSTLALNFYEGFLGFSLTSSDIELMSWDAQERFLNMTINSSRVQKYPVNKIFSRLFFKKLINLLQPLQDIHDGLYNSLCSVMSSEISDKFCYRHYVIDGDLNNVITLKETNSIVVNGTTGLKTWKAAVMLTDWALCNKEVFKNKSVLELGCGVGLTGISISKLCDTASTLLTDCHEEVLRTVCENIEINFPALDRTETSEKVSFMNDATSIGVSTLDWNLIGTLSSEVVPDVVIGADIIYDPAILPPLCNVFEVLVSRNSNATIYIMSVIRNEDTFHMFTELLGKMAYQWEIIEQEKSVFLRWDTNIRRKFLKIKKITAYTGFL